MPTVIIDTEQAELIEVSITMLEAALRARTKRADPDKIISASLALQATKLETVRALLQSPDPPDWQALPPAMAARVIELVDQLRSERDATAKQHAYTELRALINAPGFPPGAAP